MSVCSTCNGTILDRAIGGARRGTCRCQGEVFIIREHGVPVWMVRWNKEVCSPTWTERGPALAYLRGLENGRQPEYHVRDR